MEPDLPFTMEATQLRIAPVMTLTTSTGDLDVMDRVAGVGDFEAVWAHSVETTIDDVTFRTLDLVALVAAKRERAAQGPGATAGARGAAGAAEAEAALGLATH